MPNKGIDVSHFDGIVTWSDVVEAGYSFAFAKATDGMSFVDPKFYRNWSGMKEAGIKRGAYHYFRGQSGESANFLRVVESLDANDLAPVLDWEDPCACEGAKDALAWLDIVERALGKKPMIYTSPSYASALILGPRFSDYPLWIAHYGVPNPTIPAPWKDYACWQVGENSMVPGVKGPCDFNVWR